MTSITQILQLSVRVDEVVEEKSLWVCYGFDYVTVKLLCLGMISGLAAEFQQRCIVVGGT